MSTNYYAKFKLGDPRNDNAVIYTMHIGKANMTGPEHGYGMSTWSGKHFASVDDWRKFLEHNIDCVTVEDEYGIVQDTAEFIKEFLVNPPHHKTNQISWLNKAAEDARDQGQFELAESYIIRDTPEPRAWKNGYWLDDGGRLFYSGEFF